MLRYRHLEAGYNYKEHTDDKALENRGQLIYFVNNKK